MAFEVMGRFMKNIHLDMENSYRNIKVTFINLWGHVPILGFRKWFMEHIILNMLFVNLYNIFKHLIMTFYDLWGYRL